MWLYRASCRGKAARARAPDKQDRNTLIACVVRYLCSTQKEANGLFRCRSNAAAAAAAAAPVDDGDKPRFAVGEFLIER